MSVIMPDLEIFSEYLYTYLHVALSSKDTPHSKFYLGKETLDKEEIKQFLNDLMDAVEYSYCGRYKHLGEEYENTKLFTSFKKLENINVIQAHKYLFAIDYQIEHDSIAKVTTINFRPVSLKLKNIINYIGHQQLTTTKMWENSEWTHMVKEELPTNNKPMLGK